MTRKIRYEDEDAPARSRGPAGIRSLVHSVVTLAILAGMLYAAALAISRTGGFRSYVQAEISAAMGFEVTVRDARLTPGMDLAIEDVTAGRFDAPGTPCVRADRITIGWSVLPSGGSRLRSLAVETGLLAFAQGADGNWTPRPLAGVAEALVQGSGLGLDDLKQAVRAAAGRPAPPPAAPVAAAAMAARAPEPPAAAGTPASPPLCRAVVRGMDVQWWKADKSKLAFIDDLDVEITPVDDIPGRHLLHIRAGAKSFERTGGEWISPLSIECLWGDGERIVLNASAGAPRAPAAAAPQGALLPELDPPARPRK